MRLKWMKEMQGYNRNRQKRSDCVMCQVYVFQLITFSWLWPRALTRMVAKLIGDWNCLVKCKPVMFNYALINAGGSAKSHLAQLKFTAWYLSYARQAWSRARLSRDKSCTPRSKGLKMSAFKTDSDKKRSEPWGRKIDTADSWEV